MDELPDSVIDRQHGHHPSLAASLFQYRIEGKSTVLDADKHQTGRHQRICYFGNSPEGAQCAGTRPADMLGAASGGHSLRHQKK